MSAVSVSWPGSDRSWSFTQTIPTSLETSRAASRTIAKDRAEPPNRGCGARTALGSDDAESSRPRHRVNGGLHSRGSAERPRRAVAANQRSSDEKMGIKGPQFLAERNTPRLGARPKRLTRERTSRLAARNRADLEVVKVILVFTSRYTEVRWLALTRPDDFLAPPRRGGPGLSPRLRAYAPRPRGANGLTVSTPRRALAAAAMDERSRRCPSRSRRVRALAGRMTGSRHLALHWSRPFRSAANYALGHGRRPRYADRSARAARSTERVW